MKRTLKNLICTVLAVVLTAGVLSSCSGGEDFIDFIYPFSADVNSYDPQVAGTSDEFLIIENTFEGLVRMDDEGNVRSGVAENWDVSADGLTYTFNLKHGLKWNIDTEKYDEGENKGKFKDERLEMMGKEFNPDITAHDFVFALRRAALPETKCPLFATIAAIKNANKVNSGKLPASALGVKATDDYTLVITLAYPDSAFMETLTSAVAMPCNEEFFNATKGRYGLMTKYTLFNGQFYLSQILESSYLLKRNDLYLGDFPAAASELTLKIPGEKDDTVKNIKSGYYDVAYISGAESEKILSDGDLTVQPYNDTTWAMRFNTNSLVFSSKTMREAFCIGLAPLKNPDEEYLAEAKAMMPSSCRIGANNALDAVGSTVRKQNIKESVRLWKQGLEAFDVTDITIKIIATEEMQDALKQTLQGVQQGIGTVVRNSDDEKLNFVIKVETMTEEEIQTAIIKGEYDIALCSYKATSNSAISFLRSVASSGGGFDKKAVNSALTRAEKASDLKSKSKYIRKAENTIIGSYTLYPTIYETGYYVEAKNVSGVEFHMGTGRISFIKATRKD